MHSRTLLSTVARELGLWGEGKPCQYQMRTDDIAAALYARRPTDLDRRSQVVQQFYGGAPDVAQVPVQAGPPPAPPSVPTPSAAPAPAAREAVPAPVQAAGAPYVGHPAQHAPTNGAPPPGTAALYAGFDLRSYGMIAVDCPGSIALNNAVCMNCDQAEECLEQALNTQARYPENWKPENTGLEAVLNDKDLANQSLAKEAGELEKYAAMGAPGIEQAVAAFETKAAAAEVKHGPFHKSSPAPAPAKAADVAQAIAAVHGLGVPPTVPAPAVEKKPRKARAPKAAGPPSIGTPIAHADVMKLALGDYTRVFCQVMFEMGYMPYADKSALVWAKGDNPRVRMMRIAAKRPTVQFLAYQPAGGDASGLALDGTMYVWDGKDHNVLEGHLRNAIV